MMSLKLRPSILMIISLNLFIIFSCLANASDNYIDQDIVLDDSGTAYIIGDTNTDILTILDLKDDHIKGSTQELTIKEGLLWKFLYKPNINYSDIDIDLVLPLYSEIISVKSSMDYRISVKEDRHVLSFDAKDKPLDIEVGYVVSRLGIKEDDNTKDYLIFFGSVMLIGGLIYLLIFRKKRVNYVDKDKTVSEDRVDEKSYDVKHGDGQDEESIAKEDLSDENKDDSIKNVEKESTDKDKLEINEEKLDTIRLTLNENQLKIIDALVEKQGSASQTTIRYMTGIPKSSLSRNLEIMAQKSIVSKFYNGTSNFIKIHPSLYK